MMNNTNNVTDELVDIYGFWHTPWWQTKMFYACSLGIGLMLLSMLLWYLIIKLRARKKLNPWDQALLDLNALKNNPSVSYEETSALYFKLRVILKRYLIARYGNILLDKTDDELIHELSLIISSQCDNVDTGDAEVDILADIQDVLKQSALASFAAAALSLQSFFQALQKAISIVKCTIPQPVKK